MERERLLSLVPTEASDRPLSQRDDDELMQLACAGKQAAFACLVRRHQQLLRNYCARAAGNGALGDDIAQEVFASLYRARDSYVPNGRFRSYLFTIAARRCKNALRDGRVRREHRLLTGSEPCAREGSLDQLLSEERRRRLHELLASLPDAQRTAIQMRFSAGLAYAEVADAVGCSEPTARTRVHSGLSKLRSMWMKRGGL
jgi:RNA polymerase sigma factor (sigma-70 family)